MAKKAERSTKKKAPSAAERPVAGKAAVGKTKAPARPGGVASKARPAVTKAPPAQSSSGGAAPKKKVKAVEPGAVRGPGKPKVEAPAVKPKAKASAKPSGERAAERVVAPKAGKRDEAEPRRGKPSALREAAPSQRMAPLPFPVSAPVRQATVEERAAAVEKRLAQQPEEVRARYHASQEMSWIYHDSALEGVVYSFEELRSALSGESAPMADSTLQPTYDDIRRHREAIQVVRELGSPSSDQPVSVDLIKRIFLILHPEEGDLKTVKYRKDIPQHRLYFHEYAPPDKIAYKVRQIVDWINDPETKRSRSGVRAAARAHYDLLRVYPFPTDSGKTARLFMNLLLMRCGLPPAIIHSTERQRYYEALKGSATTVLQMVQESVENALASVEKLLDEHDSRKRAFIS